MRPTAFGTILVSLALPWTAATAQPEQSSVIEYPRDDAGANALEARKSAQLRTLPQFRVFTGFHFRDIVLESANGVGGVVLEETVDGIDVGAEQLLATGDGLDDVAAVVHDELQVERDTEAAGAATTGECTLHGDYLLLERGVAGIHAAENRLATQREIGIRSEREDCVALGLGEGERGDEAVDNAIEQGRHDRIGIGNHAGLGHLFAVGRADALEECGIAGDVCEQERAAVRRWSGLGCHVSPPNVARAATMIATR